MRSAELLNWLHHSNNKLTPTLEQSVSQVRDEMLNSFDRLFKQDEKREQQTSP